MDSRIDLANYFNELGFKTGAEIGVADGRFSVSLCRAIPGLKLYCVDPWDTYHGNRRGGSRDQQHKNWETAQKRLNPYGVTFMRLLSMEAVRHLPDGCLDFVFIDGNHDFDYVMQDLIEWSRKVRRGGIVSGHDYYHFNNSGVIEAVNAYTTAHHVELHITGKEIKKNPLDDKQPSFWWVKP